MDERRSESEFLKFLDYMGNKGLMNPTTAYARKKAAQAVLAVLDDTEKRDLSKIDREQTFLRFQNKNSQKFKPDSLVTYKQRFGSGLDDFLKYVENPAGFRSGSAPRATRRAAVREREDAGAAAAAITPRATVTPPTSSDLLPYPIPLPSGVVAQLYLPHKLTPADSARITQMVSALLTGLVSEVEGA